MTEVTVSSADLSDLDQLVPLVHAYRDFYGQPPSERTRDYLAERIRTDEAVVLLARVDDRPVGFTLIYPTFSTVALAPIWLLNDLFVVPDERGRGIASTLMQTAEELARQAGAARIWLRTAEDNDAAQALYEGRGWVQDRVFRRYDLLL